MNQNALFGMAGLAAVVALFLAGCGGGDSATATPARTATPASRTGAIAKDGDTVTIKYRGTLDNGEVFDPGAQPLTFKIGSGQVIAGFNDAVKGMAVGQKKTVHIEPAQAYGLRRDDLVIEVPKASAPQGVTKGAQLRLSSGAPATVIDVTDTTVKIDANHALAGKALNFDIELVSIG